MNRLMRFYTYGLLGAIGGLIGWQISNILGLSFTENLFLSEVIVGPCWAVLLACSSGLEKDLPPRTFCLDCVKPFSAL